MTDEKRGALETALSRLPQPEPPSELTAAVLARIARIEPRPLDREPRSNGPFIDLAEWPVWATVCGGAAIAVTFVQWLPIRAVARVDPLSSGLGKFAADVIAMQWSPLWALAWAAALLLYVLGLFASAGERRRS